MFGFGKTKQKENLSSVLASLATLAAAYGLRRDAFAPKSCFASDFETKIKLKTEIMKELAHLRSDHWDKDAFDRLAKKIAEL